MRKIKNFFQNSKQVLWTTAAIFFVFVLALVFICIGYYFKLKDTVYDETTGYLTETSVQTEAGIDRIIEDTFRRLDALETILCNAADVSDFEAAGALFVKLKENWDYYDITLVDADKSHQHVYRQSQDAAKVIVAADSPLKSLTEGSVLYIDHNASDGAERVNFSKILTRSIVVEDVPIGAVSLSYPLDSFYSVVSTELFGGRAYTHIIRKDGTLLVQGTKENVDRWGSNFLTSLENGVARDTTALATLRGDIADGKAGIVSLDFNGVDRYVSYCPITKAEGWYMLMVVPVEVVNEKSNELMELTMLFCVFVIVAMAALTALLIFSNFRSKRKVERLAFVDPVTGGATLQKFNLEADKLLKKTEKTMAVVYTNIEKFKVTNEQFGMETGNALLQGVSAGIESSLRTDETMGRIMADHFAILMNYDGEDRLVDRFFRWHTAILRELQSRDVSLFFPTLQLGVYVFDGESLSVPFMLDRAKLAMNEKSNILNNKISYSLYDEDAHIKLLREKQLEDCMDKALSEGQFEVYYQPKYKTDTKEIGAAEALTRWSGHAYGMVYPDEFIPLFEKNGFIIQLDLWVFGEVCKLIRRWIDEGKRPVPISVNCSRRNLKHPHFIDSYIRILNKYDVPAKYIEIELTESIMYDDTEALVEMIGELHKIGFLCSIDDFGSGYSSLSMIQGIPVDVLKLDKIFFRNTLEGNNRAVSVIEAIIRMAKSLEMRTVAEGVELPDQVGMLEEIGCDYIQGFIFSKPVPLAEFERLAFPEESAPAQALPEAFPAWREMRETDEEIRPDEEEREDEENRATAQDRRETAQDRRETEQENRESEHDRRESAQENRATSHDRRETEHENRESAQDRRESAQENRATDGEEKES